MAAVHLVSLALLVMFLRPAPVSSESREFYMHDNFNIQPISAVRAAAPPNISSKPGGSFGVIVVIDDPITAEPVYSPDKIIGRAQGTYMFTALDGSSLLLTFTAVFGNDTLSFHGADRLNLASRDIAIIGGTGKYRFARGYATMETTSNSTILHFTCNFELS